MQKCKLLLGDEKSLFLLTREFHLPEMYLSDLSNGRKTYQCLNRNQRA